MGKQEKNHTLIKLLLSGVGGTLFIKQLLSVTTSKQVIVSPKIPNSFDGFKILHLSDLHNNSLICRDDRLFSRIKSLHPDIVVITGDIIDRIDTHLEVATDLVSKLATLFPVYYVPGNHEANIAERDILFRQLKNAGAKLLFDTREDISIDGERITITGIMDPGFKKVRTVRKIPENMLITMSLRKFPKLEQDVFNILLSHKPKFFSIYSDYMYDLILSGHAHGGQWRFPYVGAVFSPSEGLFPTFTSGIHKRNNSAMIVSRGLGNTVLPLRINNPFELVLITLRNSYDY